MPARVIETAEQLRAARCERAPPGDGVWVGIAGLDLVRDEEGRWLVLEDNVRTPSGIGYWWRRARRGRPHARASAMTARRRDQTCRGRSAARRRAAAARSCSPTGRATPPTGSTAGSPSGWGSRSSTRPTSRCATDRLWHARRAVDVDVPPHRRRPSSTRRSGALLRRSLRAGTLEAGQLLRHRRRRRQARARLRRRHGPLLPRRGAAAARGRDLRPRPCRSARARARHASTSSSSSRAASYGGDRRRGRRARRAERRRRPARERAAPRRATSSRSAGSRSRRTRP